MHKFAHISDMHLGFHNRNLQQIEQQIFEKIFDICINKKVDFILITGDIFHSHIPAMHIQTYVFKKFREVYEANIPIYVIFGSHDSSPITSSVVDIITIVGFFNNVTQKTIFEEDSIQLDFIEEQKTHVKITGISGRTSGLDKEYFEKLNRKHLKNEKGFKIFLFHSGINELTKSNDEMVSISLSSLPIGFNYYAGGHVHTFTKKEVKNYGTICYPGTPFAGYHSDLEENANGKKRGFVIVDFDTEIQKVNFIEINDIDCEIVECNVSGKIPDAVNLDLLKQINKLTIKNKIILIKIWGELKSGKIRDINLLKFKEELFGEGAIDVQINRRNLKSKEYVLQPLNVKSKEDLENKILEQNILSIKNDQNELLGKHGLKLAKTLLQEFKQPIALTEKKKDYQRRIQDETLKFLEFEI